MAASKVMAPLQQPGGAAEGGPLTARSGREKQRYADGCRLVAGCIPIRGAGEQTEVLMLTTRHGHGLIFPKGGWETDETAAEGAARESLEEGGVRGVLESSPLPPLPFTSKTQRCTAHVFVMRVTDVLDEWPEAAERTRHWCRVPEAIARCRHVWMRQALEAWRDRAGL